MKLAITDACIFIDLCDLGLVTVFFRLELEVHTSVDVFNELFPAQQDLLKAFQSGGKLTVHSLNEPDRHSMSREDYPRSLSDSDKTVLHLAVKLNAMVLSSDKVVRNFAKKRAIEHHGMIWIFDRLVDEALLSPAEAAEKLIKLINTNFIYRNNENLVAEMHARLNRWR